MKILSIGSDRNLFMEKSNVRQRILEYGALARELHIVVFARKDLGFEVQQISDNVWIYPTNSRNRWFFVHDAIRIGKRVAKKMGEQKEDAVVTAQDPFEAGFVGWRIASAFSLPLQIQVHTDLFSPFFTQGSLLNTFRVRLAKFLLPKATCVRVVSERIKTSLVEVVPTLQRKPVVLPIFVDVTDESSGSEDAGRMYPQFDMVVLMVGRLEKEKNIPLAFSVMVEVIQKNPKVGLVILGEGHERKNLEELAEDLGISENIIFAGAVKNTIPYYKSADIFLHTSNYEGYGMALMEAATAKCPIVTTDVGIAGALLKDGEGALVCPVGDKQCLQESIKRLLEDKELGSTLSKGAQNVVAEKIKNKEEYLKEYVRLWRQCL